jgi:hypothetical protein
MLPVLYVIAEEAPAEVVDRIVAAVNEQLITASDVQLETALSSLDASPSPFWSGRRADALTRLVHAAALRQPAGDVPLYQPHLSEVRGRMQGIRQHFDRTGWEAFLERYGLDEESLLSLLKRRIIVERYLARQLLVARDDEPAWEAAYTELIRQVLSQERVYLIPPMGG